MSSDFSAPRDPETRASLRDAVYTATRGEAPRITIVKQAVRRNKGRMLGVFPASFNPPTKAHEALVRVAQRVVPLDECLLLLDLKAVGKEVFGASLEDRLVMLLILFGEKSACSLGICNRGLFLEKIAAVHHAYPKDTEIHFIVGHDTPWCASLTVSTMVTEIWICARSFPRPVFWWPTAAPTTKKSCRRCSRARRIVPLPRRSRR